MTSPILYVFSGAGLSAESGVPTFRTAGGLWTQANLDRVCNFNTWKNHRSDVFEFYSNRRKEMSGAAPNGAHLKLAQWQNTFSPERVKLLTQNVDPLLERAGASHVIHLHGDMQHLLCTACGERFVVEDKDYHEHTRCVSCDSLKGVKPGVVFFHEMAPEYAHLNTMVRRIKEKDILLVIGTAFQVVTAERLIPRQRRLSALNWQVNPHCEEREWFHKNIEEGAVAGLQTIEEELLNWMEK